MLEEDLPDLLPELRPYQCRAAYWMVHREKGDSMNLAKFFSPLCLPLEFLDSSSKMFYNPFRYFFIWAQVFFQPCWFYPKASSIPFYLPLPLCMLTINDDNFFFSVEMFRCAQIIVHQIFWVVFLLVVSLFLFILHLALSFEEITFSVLYIIKYQSLKSFFPPLLLTF